MGWRDSIARVLAEEAGNIAPKLGEEMPEFFGAARRPKPTTEGRGTGLPPAAPRTTMAPPPTLNYTPTMTGSPDPLQNVPVTFNGKQLKDFNPQDWKDFGDAHGVPNLGPLSPLQTFKDTSGNDVQIPGGTEGKWTYYDLLHMKANPINPSNLDRGLHAQMQQKLGRTMTPPAPSDENTWNGLVFGMTSMNNPLFPNQLAASRLRMRSPQTISDLASSIPWQAGDKVPKDLRTQYNIGIGQKYGLGAAPAGLGVRGPADYTRIAELAQMFQKDPQFFRKSPNEEWQQYVERLTSQVPGLSMKTGSFGGVWQDPANAEISAIDRHMVKKLEDEGGIFANDAERQAWQDRAVERWNNNENDRVAEQTALGGKRAVAPADLATDYNDLTTKSGFDGFRGDMLLEYVGNSSKPKFRTAKGDINPNLPPHLANANWPVEPTNVNIMGPAYGRALDLNQQLADQAGLNLFPSQWMEWDRIRNRFEPHENQFPGLSQLPAPSIDQLREVDLAHKATGHKTYGKDDEGSLQPTRPFDGNPSALGYLGVGGVGLGSLMAQPDQSQAAQPDSDYPVPMGAIANIAGAAPKPFDPADYLGQ